MAEGCHYLRSSIAELLKMPARRFFAILRSAKRQEYERNAHIMIDVTYAAICAQAKYEFIQDVLKGLRARIDPPEKLNDNRISGAKLTALLGAQGKLAPIAQGGRNG